MKGHPQLSFNSTAVLLCSLLFATLTVASSSEESSSHQRFLKSLTPSFAEGTLKYSMEGSRPAAVKLAKGEKGLTEKQKKAKEQKQVDAMSNILYAETKEKQLRHAGYTPFPKGEAAASQPAKAVARENTRGKGM